MQSARCTVRYHTTWTILQNDDANNLALRCNAFHEHQMALITSGCVPSRPAVVGLELEAKWPAVGQPYWRAAGVGHCIDLKIGPAADSLAALQAGLHVDASAPAAASAAPPATYLEAAGGGQTKQQQAAETRCVSRRRDCHSAAPPSSFSRCFNRDRERASAK